MTPEQQQRIEQIEKRLEHGYSVSSPTSADVMQLCDDLRDLLSLVKSQEAGVWANEIRLRLERTRDLKADTGSVKDQAFIDGGRAALERLLEDIEEDYTPERNDAATSMRSACVEKVKALSTKKMAQYDLDHERYGHLLEQAIALDEAVVELESVSIQEQEAKQS